MLPWLQVETGYSRTWSVTVSVGVDTDVYSSTPSLTNAAGAVADLVTWLNSFARAWYGTVYFAARWDSTATAKANPVVYLTGAGTFDWTPDAAAIAAMGWAAGAGITATTGTGLAGSWFPARGAYLRRWLRTLASGPAAAVGALRPGQPGDAGQAGGVEAVTDESAPYSLTQALRAATLPRRGLVYDDRAAQWVDVALGAVTQERLQPQVYRVRIAVLGG
jgi:hypothetical protein